VSRHRPAITNHAICWTAAPTGSYRPRDSHELVYSSGCIGGPISHQFIRNRKTLKTLNGLFHAPVGRRHHRVWPVPIAPMRADATGRWPETGPRGTGHRCAAGNRRAAADLMSADAPRFWTVLPAADISLSETQIIVSDMEPTHCGALRGCAGRRAWTCPSQRRSRPKTLIR